MGILTKITSIFFRKDKPLTQDIEVKNNGVVKAIRKMSDGVNYYAIFMVDTDAWVNDVYESELEHIFDLATRWAQAPRHRVFLDGTGRYWPYERGIFIVTKRFNEYAIKNDHTLAVDVEGVVYDRITNGVPEDGYSALDQVESYFLELKIKEERKRLAGILTPV